MSLRVARAAAPVRLLVVMVVAMGLSVSVLAVSAGAAPTSFVRVGVFAEQGPDGALRHSGRIAVEPVTGAILRSDPVGDRVVVYRSSDTGANELTSFGSGELVDPFGVAVDQASGAVYVADAGNSRIVRYTSDGADPPVYALDPSFTSPAAGNAAAQVGSFAASLAVDPVSGNLLVADPGNNRVKRYDSTGAYLGSFDGTGSPSAFAGLQDLAIDSTGDVIVIDSDGTDPADGGVSRVERFAADGSWKSTLGPVAGAATVAVRPVNDEIVVSGNQDAVNRDEKPTLFVLDALSSRQLTVDDPVAYSTVSGIAIGSGLSGRLYVATDTSRGNYPTAYGLAGVQVYIPPDPPAIDAASVQTFGVAATSAGLSAQIDPGRAATTVHFEYGTTTAYGQSTASIDAGSGDAARQVTSVLEGLQPSTTYHYRLVADNGIGAPVTGADHTLTTAPSVPQPDTGAVSAITTSTATVSGSVDTHGLAGKASFSIVQTDGAYSQSVGPIDLSAVDGPQPVTATATGLPVGGRYTVRIAATTSGGVRSGSPVAFSTNALPGYQPPAPVPDDGPWTAPPPSSPPAGVPVTPSERFTARVKVTGTLATFTIVVPGPGVVKATGTRIVTATKSAKVKGGVTLKAKLTKAGRKALRTSKGRKLTVKVKLAYTPTAGTTQTLIRTITFKRGGAR